MQHPAESGRYVKLYNAMLYYIVNLIAFNLLVNNTTDTFVSLYYCFYIRQYVKDRFCALPFCGEEDGFNSFHSLYPSTEWRITDSNRWPPACKAGALASWANPP